ncbi:MAG: hypothetical protein ABW170_06130 [Candidatus Thiodiazotropha sp. L084R]
MIGTLIRQFLLNKRWQGFVAFIATIATIVGALKAEQSITNDDNYLQQTLCNRDKIENNNNNSVIIIIEVNKSDIIQRVPESRRKVVEDL